MFMFLVCLCTLVDKSGSKYRISFDDPQMYLFNLLYNVNFVLVSAFIVSYTIFCFLKMTLIFLFIDK